MQYPLKETYVDSSNKRKVRDFLLSFFNLSELKTVVGLAGPDINQYIDDFKDKGFERFEIWENDKIIAQKQLSDMESTDGISYNFGDIIKARPNKSTALYDLDYMRTINFLCDHVKRFKRGKFIITMCVRGRDSSREDTISKFFKERTESIRTRFDKIEPINHTVVGTDFGKYVIATYRDTTPMICIAKIN